MGERHDEGSGRRLAILDGGLADETSFFHSGNHERMIWNGTLCDGGDISITSVSHMNTEYGMK